MFLLVGGDLSGIQKFIYRISAGGALKLLRARSFFLELFMEDVIQEILDRIGLSRANVIYAGGGHFYILAPNTKKAKKNLDDIENEANDWLLKEFEGDLSLIMSRVMFSGEQFKEGNFAELWKRVGEKLSIQKSQKFKKSLVENPTKVLMESNYEKNKNLCGVCGKAIPEKLLIDENKDIRGCKRCKELHALGRELTKKKLILRISSKEKLKNHLDLPFGDYSLYLDENEIKTDLANLCPGKVTVFIKNTLDAPHEIANENIKIIPIQMGDYNIDNNDLDTLADGAHGAKKIAILRMDVDNLGKIFLRGLPRNEMTISRMSTLSRFLRACQGHPLYYLLVSL